MTETVLFIGTEDDKPYLQHLRGAIKGDVSVKLSLSPCEYTSVAEATAKRYGATKIITTSAQLLHSLVGATGRKKPKVSDYAGSMFHRGQFDYVVIDPLQQLVTTRTGKFLTSRYCSKLTNKKAWYQLPEFKWTLMTPSNVDSLFEQFQSAIMIGIDIETVKENLAITCISFTAMFKDLTTSTVVIEMNDMLAVYWMRKFCWELKAPKVLQNGKYDISYLTRWNCPVYNYMLDTISMMHCTYSELPKTLDALAVYWLWDAVYWKDMANTSDRMEYFKYNALDSWYAVLIAMVWLLDAPQYAKQNYLQEFPLVFPTHLCDMTGVQRDMERLREEQVKRNKLCMEMQASLEKMVCKEFNPGSPKQVKQLLKALGCGDLESSDEKNLKKAVLRHPLNSRILNKILDIRGENKLLSTYQTEGKELDGTILYSIVPWGTDTGRLACQESAFWCGLQIQNIPRGEAVKRTIRSYAGFRFAECDLEQAESRDTAYISGEEALIRAVESGRDFHSLNASAFFGVPYSEIYSDEEYYDEDGTFHKAGTLDKPLRDLAKRVNHGANYNMGANVLIDTMGEDKIREAQRLLNLPRIWALKQVAEYLLGVFHSTYPGIKRNYYTKVINDVTATKMLVGATGWTRYCFGNPSKDKRDLNAYVAHYPQSLNAKKLNIAFMRVFYEVALPNPTTFRLCAQIHDSILFQFAEGMTDLAEKVKELMHVTISITAATGKKYTYTVPAALKAGKDGQGAEYWSDTE